MTFTEHQPMADETTAGSFNMTNIVVIDGTGLIGSKPVARLAEHGHQAIWFQDKAVLDFFTTPTSNLLPAEKTANASLEVAALRPQNALQIRRD